MRKYTCLITIVLLISVMAAGCASDTADSEVQNVKNNDNIENNTPSEQATPKEQATQVTTQKSKTTMQLSESKKNELIEYVKQYTGSTEITVIFIPSNDGVKSGVISVDFYLDNIPNANDLNNNIAAILILSKAVAEESGIQNPDVTVCAEYTTGKGLGVGNYYSSTGKTNIDVSDCHS